MPNLRRIAVSSRVLRGKSRQGVGGNDEHPAKSRKRRGDLFRQTGGEMRVLLSRPDKVQRHDADMGATGRPVSLRLRLHARLRFVWLLSGDRRRQW